MHRTPICGVSLAEVLMAAAQLRVDGASHAACPVAPIDGMSRPLCPAPRRGRGRIVGVEFVRSMRRGASPGWSDSALVPVVATVYGGRRGKMITGSEPDVIAKAWWLLYAAERDQRVARLLLDRLVESYTPGCARLARTSRNAWSR
jgi:hypothetical protein